MTEAGGTAEAPTAEEAAPAEEMPAAAVPAAPERDLTPEELIAAMEASFKDFNDGDIVDGEVVKIDRDEVLLDIGYKSEGVIPSKELSIRHDVDPNEVVKVGDQIEALVLQKEDKEGRLILSKKRAQYERAWGRIEEVMTSGETIKGPVIEVVKGGLILDIGLRGFLPASLVDLRRVRDLHPFVGTELEAKIIELDRNRNNVVLSRRAFLEESQSEGRKTFLQSLQKGERRKGTVSSIVNFGAFVDLGGVDGLVHVSELSLEARRSSAGGRGGRPGGRGRGARRRPRARARVALAQGHAGGSLEGVRAHVARPARSSTAGHEARAVRRVRPRRCRASRASCTSPRSATSTSTRPESVLSVGDEVQVKVIDVDVSRRRVSLSMRQVVGAAASVSPRSRPSRRRGASRPRRWSPTIQIPDDILAAVAEAERRGGDRTGAAGRDAPWEKRSRSRAAPEPEAAPVTEAEAIAVAEEAVAEAIVEDLVTEAVAEAVGRGSDRGGHRRRAGR